MFTGTSNDNRRVTIHNSRALIKGQSVYMGYSPLHRPVFLVNSRSKQLCVIEDFWLLRPSFSRSYRSILSSSLSRVFSITLVDLLLDHHCRFRVRFIFLCFFLSLSEWKSDIQLPVPNQKHTVNHKKDTESFSVFSSYKAIALLVRDRLNVRRLSVRTNPWSFGDEGFHFVFRYSCQHSY